MFRMFSISIATILTRYRKRLQADIVLSQYLQKNVIRKEFGVLYTVNRYIMKYRTKVEKGVGG